MKVYMDMININDELVENYLECYNKNKINIDEIKQITEIFNLLKDHELEDANYIENDFVKSGVRIIKKEKNFDAKKIIVDIQKYISFFAKNTNDLYFSKSLYSLLDSMPYISTDDRICLNSIFDGMLRCDQGIGGIKEIENEKYLIKYNYKTKEFSKKIEI